MRKSIFLIVSFIVITVFVMLGITFIEERASENGTAPCWVYKTLHKDSSPFSMNTTQVQKTIKKCNLIYENPELLEVQER